jgi:hypothetical protein
MHYQRVIPKRVPQTYHLMLLAVCIMALGSINPLRFGRPTTWIGWLLAAGWGVSYLTLVGIVWTKINRQMKELEKPDDELIRQREQLKAEYERFKPDLEQVRTYYYDDPSNESLRERFESISQHQDSLLRQIRTIDGLLNVMPHGN